MAFADQTMESNAMVNRKNSHGETSSFGTGVPSIADACVSSPASVDHQSCQSDSNSHSFRHNSNETTQHEESQEYDIDDELLIFKYMMSHEGSQMKSLHTWERFLNEEGQNLSHNVTADALKAKARRMARKKFSDLKNLVDYASLDQNAVKRILYKFAKK